MLLIIMEEATLLIGLNNNPQNRQKVKSWQK